MSTFNQMVRSSLFGLGDMVMCRNVTLGRLLKSGSQGKSPLSAYRYQKATIVRRITMAIDGAEKMDDWGKKTPINDNSHISQTNSNSRDGEGTHVTTNISGTNAKVHDRFDSDGNYIGTNYGKR